MKHFQLHDFNKINLYIIEVFTELESGLKVENLSMWKLNTIFPYALNSAFNGNNFSNVKNAFVYSKFNLPKINYYYKKSAEVKKKGGEY